MKLTWGEKSLAALGTPTSISLVTGFSGSLYALTYPCPSMCKNLHENAQH